jgi:DNA (cytosine-5)-methyltransferase 1
VDRGVDERQRWKLVGNAVTAGVSDWLAARLTTSVETSDSLGSRESLSDGMPWPHAACGQKGKRWKIEASSWPEQRPYTHLLDLLDHELLQPLSYRATKGFRNRLVASSLRYAPDFMEALNEHVRFMHHDD